MTDLEACVEAPGRAELVKQVREKINELGPNPIKLTKNKAAVDPAPRDMAETN